MRHQFSLIIAPEDDIHAFAVKREAEIIGRNVYIIDSGTFFEHGYLATQYCVPSMKCTLHTRQGDYLNLSQASGLWWRRPNVPGTSTVSGHPGIDQVVREECSAVFYGSLVSHVSNHFNNQERSRAASNKLWQLAAARSVGFHVPDTLVTNDFDEAIEFINERNWNVIYKMLRSVPFGVYGTRRISQDDVHLLKQIKKCPVLLQELVYGRFDLRATVVGREIFAARIDYRQESEIVDSRLTASHLENFELPDHINGRLIKMMDLAGLTYGAFDLRQTNEGEVVFFELNPEGQYLWTEIECGLPISAAIARQLDVD